MRKLFKNDSDKLLITAMLVIVTPVLGYLAYLAVSGTYFYRFFEGSGPVLVSEDPKKQLLLSLIVSAVVFVLGFAWKGLFEAREKRTAKGVLFFSSAAMLLLGIVFLMHHPYYMIGDQLNTFYGGVYAAGDDPEIRYLMFMPGGYLGIYPQQKGLVFIYMNLYHIFGDRLFTVMKWFHLVYPQMILYAGYGVLEEDGINAFSRSLYCILIATCLPLYLYLPYMYGDLGTVAFCFGMTYFAIRFMRTRKIWFFIPMCLCSAMAIILRMQSWIFMIAIAIVLLLLSISNKRAIFVVAALLILTSAYSGSYLIEKHFDRVSGYGSVEGVPAIAWVAMGLQTTNGDPGVYNRYNQGTFESTDFDAEKTAVIAKEDARESFKYLMKNFSSEGREFFVTKLRQEWTNPDFGGYFETSGDWSELSGNSPEDAPEWLRSLYYGEYYDLAMKQANRYQSFVHVICFALALMMLFKRDKSVPFTVQLSFIYVIGGFIFFLFWENKSRYILPFFVSLIWVTPVIFSEIFGYMERQKKRL